MKRALPLRSRQYSRSTNSSFCSDSFSISALRSALSSLLISSMLHGAKAFGAGDHAAQLPGMLALELGGGDLLALGHAQRPVQRSLAHREAALFAEIHVLPPIELSRHSRASKKPGRGWCARGE